MLHSKKFQKWMFNGIYTYNPNLVIVNACRKARQITRQSIDETIVINAIGGSDRWKKKNERF